MRIGIDTGVVVVDRDSTTDPGRTSWWWVRRSTGRAGSRGGATGRYPHLGRHPSARPRDLRAPADGRAPAEGDRRTGRRVSRRVRATPAIPPRRVTRRRGRRHPNDRSRRRVAPAPGPLPGRRRRRAVADGHHPRRCWGREDPPARRVRPVDRRAAGVDLVVPGSGGFVGPRPSKRALARRHGQPPRHPGE